MGVWKQMTGSIGAVFAGLCCLGFAPALGLLSAIGAGFLINDLILIPLFAIFLGMSIWGLKGSAACHKDKRPFYLGTSSALIAFVTIWFIPVVSYIGLLGLICASIWDISRARACRV